MAIMPCKSGQRAFGGRLHLHYNRNGKVETLERLEVFHVQYPDGRTTNLHLDGAGHVELGGVEGAGVKTRRTRFGCGSWRR